ncbi:Fur family transcriptional regulator [Methylobacterium nodulans]|nr:Fur family transcriptional regulator [Methylobacterium nodulans]
MAEHTHARVSGAPHDVTAIVARVERYCAEHGVAFTPMRRRVLEVLAASVTPLSAYDLAERVRQEKRVSPVQVYRVLEFLQGAGVVHRLATKSAYIACYHEHGPGETTVFLVCSGCGAVEEATSRAIQRVLKGAAAVSGFKPLHPVVEVEGECAACQRH